MIDVVALLNARQGLHIASPDASPELRRVLSYVLANELTPRDQLLNVADALNQAAIEDGLAGAPDKGLSYTRLARVIAGVAQPRA